MELGEREGERRKTKEEKEECERAGARQSAAFLRRPDQLQQLSFLINSFRLN